MMAIGDYVKYCISKQCVCVCPCVITDRVETIKQSIVALVHIYEYFTFESQLVPVGLVSSAPNIGSQTYPAAYRKIKASE